VRACFCISLSSQRITNSHDEKQVSKRVHAIEEIEREKRVQRKKNATRLGNFGGARDLLAG
jgi:hypothetical protein